MRRPKTRAGTYICITCKVGAPIRVTSDLWPTGFNQTEPVVGRAVRHLPSTLHDTFPSLEPRTVMATSTCGAGDLGPSLRRCERSSANRVDQPKSLDDLSSIDVGELGSLCRWTRCWIMIALVINSRMLSPT